MLVLKRHYQFWYVIMALHKIGAVAVPATHLLTAKDIVYRCNRADVKAVICTTDHDFPKQVDLAQKDSPTLKLKFYTNGSKKQKEAEQAKMREEGRLESWIDLDEAVEAQSEDFQRPQGDEDAQYAAVFYVRHIRIPQNGSTHVFLSAGTYHHGRLLAQRQRKRTAFDRRGNGMGESRMGKALRAMARGNHNLRI